ncbi:MAG: nucleotide exchange factor GrpE [Lachnospiraceae bacterium]|nr:nucleotide exchange factor GrpE [Lachnospiraceae bacterium]MBO4824597.1 nucleotide exchange factor GrpE [Lachnospiraceae bacterium]MBR5761534.1 nucleotide exchange factor GrpE [Lachnospiraceae bacterium]MBR5994236.1 nucleotide exchange factor GrpE [Lachnospiraceae bacterium]
MTDLTEERKEPLQDEETVTEDTVTEETAEEETKETVSEEASEATDDKKDKKKNKADKKVDELKEKIKELEDGRLRQIAEFQNFRNRTEKEKSQMFDLGAKNVIEKILPVVDNFERGLASIPEDEKNSSFAQGMEKIYKQLMTELDNLGVKPIEAKGTEFNPEFHNAVMQVESDEFESGIVAEELQKGYTYHDTVVRHSMVSVVS